MRNITQGHVPAGAVTRALARRRDAITKDISALYGERDRFDFRLRYLLAKQKTALFKSNGITVKIEEDGHPRLARKVIFADGEVRVFSCGRTSKLVVKVPGA